MNGQADVTTIGRGTVVRGRVTGAASLEILGRVEGEVEVQGDLLLDAQGLAAANLSGRRVTIRGAVRGDVVASEAIVLEDGARVVGDVRAPRIAIAAGALVRGYVQTGDAVQPAGGRTRAQPVATPVQRPAASAASAPPRAPARTAPAPASAPSVAAPARPPAQSAAQAAQSSAQTTERITVPRHLTASAQPAATTSAPAASTTKGPPPPVVPVLKKGAKGAMTKKRG